MWARQPVSKKTTLDVDLCEATQQKSDTVSVFYGLQTRVRRLYEAKVVPGGRAHSWRVQATRES